jgi:hypothetical protein
MNYMKTSICTAAAIFSAPSASATVLLPGEDHVPFSAFVGSLGTQVDSNVISGVAPTFRATLWTAVYRNDNGWLDFLYQVRYDGPGASGAEPVERISASNFDSFPVDAQISYADIDGAGFFSASNMSAARAPTADRSDGVLGVDFNVLDKLSAGEISPIVIFRTDRTNYTSGFAQVSDGTSFFGAAFQPTGVVPETTTWMTMLIGFGALGSVMRRRRGVARTI